MGIEPDGSIRHCPGDPAGRFLATVEMVPASQLGDLAKAHQEHITELREQRDEARRLVGRIDLDDPAQLRVRADELDVIYGAGISPAAAAVRRHLLTAADRIEKKRAEAEKDAAYRTRAEEYARARWEFDTPTYWECVDAYLAGLRDRAEEAS